jgi:hypothetical protein
VIPCSSVIPENGGEEVTGWWDVLLYFGKAQQ